MGLFDNNTEKPTRRFPNRHPKYRQDVEHLCRCDARYCNQDHEPEKCKADELDNIYIVANKHRWFICPLCVRDIRANGVKIVQAQPGSSY